MKLTLSEEDSLKLHELLGDEFWENHKRLRRRRLIRNIMVFVSMMVVAVLYHHYQTEIRSYLSTLFEHLAIWVESFYG